MNKQIVTAEEFVLVNDKGRPLAMLGREGSQGATLCFFDRWGARRCVIGVDSQGTPLITLGDDQEQPCLCLSQTKDDAGMKILDKDGQVRVQVGVDGMSNQAFVSLGSASAQNQLVLFANADGSTSVILHNSEGVPMLGLRVHPNGNPAFLVEQLGNILETLDGSPSGPDSHEPASKDMSPQGLEELDGEMPQDGFMADSACEPDAWEKTGIVY